MDWHDYLNDFYKKFPPKIVLDDLGIHHEIEVPLPGKYKKVPCKCGIIHKWEDPETFLIYEEPRVNGKLSKKCETCGDVLVLELVGEYGKS